MAFELNGYFDFYFYFHLSRLKYPHYFSILIIGLRLLKFIELNVSDNLIK